MRTDRNSGAGDSGHSSHAGEAPQCRPAAPSRHSRRSLAVKAPQCRPAALSRLGPQGRGAFTLVELLVVMAIIAILAGLLMPAISAALNKAHEARTANLIHQCQIAATSFFNDHGDYPPSTYVEMFQMFGFDPNGDGVIDNDDFTGFSVNPRGFNEGIEVFLACVATRDGGPYLEPTDWQLVNTDGDQDDQDIAGNGVYDIADATNWYFGSGDLFELGDWWGNPLVYIHNRDYVNSDGWDNALGAPNSDSNEAMPYIGVDGEQLYLYSRDGQGLQTQNPPNLNSFQLYSIGSDGVDNDDLFTDIGDVNGDSIIDYEMALPWNLKHGVLANWEE